jgi:hypothetical protein
LAERKQFDCSLEYHLSAAFGESSHRTCTARAQNICANGLGILTCCMLERGAVVRLGFPLSSLEILLPVFAEVAWAVPANNGFRAGLRFLK